MTQELAERALESLRSLEKLAATPPTRTTEPLLEAKAGYFTTMAAYQRHGIDPAEYLGPIWANNLERHLVPNILQSRCVEEAIGYLNDKAFYDFSCAEPFLSPSLRWRVDFLRRRHGVEVDDLPAAICESPFVLQKHCRNDTGRLLSSDFLNRLGWVYRLQDALPFPAGPFTVLEIGGGFGALSRVFKLLHPRSRHVLVDIPESLFFQHAFLRASFPDARHQYIAGPDDIVRDDADFVYVPNAFANVLKDREFFLAVNTNSFGEMPEKASSRWLDLVENETRTANVFFLNRFLNRITEPMLETRHGHSSWSFMLDARWSFREWEVDPDYERCPYFQTTLTRNLHVIATRAAEPGAELAALVTRGQDAKLEDWSLRPGWRDFKFVTNADDYPPLMSRGDLELTPDLTKHGTLYTLWSLVRLTRHQGWFDALVAYLDYLNGQQAETFFEEIPTLVQMRALLPAQA